MMEEHEEEVRANGSDSDTNVSGGSNYRRDKILQPKTMRRQQKYHHLRSPLKQNRRRAKLNTLGTQWARWDAVRNKLMVMAKENLAEAIVFIAFPNKKQNSYYIEQYGSLTEKLLLSESGKKLIREWYKLDPRSYHQGKQGTGPKPIEQSEQTREIVMPSTSRPSIESTHNEATSAQVTQRKSYGKSDKRTNRRGTRLPEQTSDSESDHSLVSPNEHLSRPQKSGAVSAQPSHLQKNFRSSTQHTTPTAMTDSESDTLLPLPNAPSGKSKNNVSSQSSQLNSKNGKSNQQTTPTVLSAMSNSQREVIQTSQSRASLGSQEKTATSGHPRQQDTNSGKSNQRADSIPTALSANAMTDSDSEDIFPLPSARYSKSKEKPSVQSNKFTRNNGKSNERAYSPTTELPATARTDSESEALLPLPSARPSRSKKKVSSQSSRLNSNGKSNLNAEPTPTVLFEMTDSEGELIQNLPVRVSTRSKEKTAVSAQSTRLSSGNQNFNELPSPKGSPITHIEAESLSRPNLRPKKKRLTLARSSQENKVAASIPNVLFRVFDSEI